MNAIYRLLVRLRAVLLFIALEVIAALLFTNSSYYQHSKIVGGIRVAKATIDAKIDSWQQYFFLKEENDRLALENNALRNRLERYEWSMDTVRALTALDSLRQPMYSYIPATVVSNSVNTLHNYITLNAGTQQGVTKGMGVITPDGIIGTVDYVSEHYALVRSVLNTEWKVSAKLATDGTFGSLYWNGINYRELLLAEIPRHIPVAIGDTIVSSGYSAFFPPNIPIGTVKQVASKRGIFHEITVTLFADFKKLHHVNVVNYIYRNELKELEALNE